MTELSTHTGTELAHRSNAGMDVTLDDRDFNTVHYEDTRLMAEPER